MTLTDSELDRRLAALPRQTEAPEALWRGIEARISRRWPWMSAMAAAMVVAVLVISFRVDEPAGTRGVDSTASLVAAEVESMSRMLPDDASQWVSAEFDAGWHEAWEHNQVAIGELQSALERNPDNRLLLDFLARAHLRQSDLINQAVASGAMEEQRSIFL